MQIHELNNFSDNLDSSAFVAVDNGSDTGKVTIPRLLSDATQGIAEANDRIDNIIAGGTAPSEAEVTDARLGADGKVYSSVGAAIRSQIENIDAVMLHTFFDADIWEQGAIVSGDGTNTASTTRIRTAGYISKYIDVISPLAGYKFLIAAYDNTGAYKGVWNGTALANAGTWFTSELTVRNLPDYNYRLVFADTANGTILPSAGENCNFKSNVDESLSMLGIPADAKETGKKINEMSDYIDNIAADYLVNIIHHESTNHLDLDSIGVGKINADGTIDTSSTTNNHSDYIEVSEGDVVRMMYVSGGNQTISFRFAFYDENKNFISGNDVGAYRATAPEGAKYIRVSAQSAYFSYPIAVTFNVVTADYQYEDYFAPYNTYTDDFLTPETKAIIEAFVDDALYVKAKADTLDTGETLTVVQKIDSRKNNVIEFYADISSLTSLTIGHGYQVAYGSWIEIDGTNITTYYDDTSTQGAKASHGLTLSGFIHVLITQNNAQRASVKITTASGDYTLSDCPWFACNGDVFAFCTGSLTGVSETAIFKDFSSDIFLFGDSYTGLDSARYPYYLIHDGYTDFLVCGYGGAHSQRMITCFQNVIVLAKPKFAIWALGMNDKDGANTYNANWKAALDTFLSVCESNGVTPILATIPNVTDSDYKNTYKNAYVKSLDYRYIDFAKAVDGEAEGASWYAGMLSNDGVHPTALGAKALCSRFLADVPEVIR